MFTKQSTQPLASSDKLNHPPKPAPSQSFMNRIESIVDEVTPEQNRQPDLRIGVTRAGTKRVPSAVA